MRVKANGRFVLSAVVMLAVAIGGGMAAVLKAREGTAPAAPLPPEAMPQYSPLYRARVDVAWAFGKAGIERCREYVELLARHAARHGIDGKVFASIAVKESHCEPLAVSGKRAAGLMQIHLPFWQCTPEKIAAKKKCWDFTLPENNPFTPERNVAMAAEILAELLREYGTHEAIRRYNGAGGRGAAVKAYADAVIAAAQ